MQTQHTGNGSNGTPFSWPSEGTTRVPYQVFFDPDIYAQEQATLFRGRTWNYVALEAEVAKPGDFKSTFIGDTPIVVTRDKEGGLQALPQHLHWSVASCPAIVPPTPVSTTSGVMI